MWFTLAGSLEMMQQNHHHHLQTSQSLTSSSSSTSSIGPSWFQIASIPRRQRRVFKVMVVAHVLVFAAVVVPLVTLHRRQQRWQHSSALFFPVIDSSSWDTVDATDNGASPGNGPEPATPEAVLASDAMPRGRRLLASASFSTDAKRRAAATDNQPIFSSSPIQQGGDAVGDTTNNKNNNGNINKDANATNANGNSNTSSNSVPDKGGNLKLSLQLSLYADAKDEHNLLVQLAVQNILMDVLCQSNEVLVLYDPNGAATNLCLTNNNSNNKLNRGRRDLSAGGAAATHLEEGARELSWQDASANGYYTVLNAEPAVQQRPSQYNYITYDVWSVVYPVLNMGALYRNQVSTNQQNFGGGGSTSNTNINSNTNTDEAAAWNNQRGSSTTSSNAPSDDVIATDDAIQLSAVEIFAKAVQVKVDKLLSSGAFDTQLRVLAPNATAHGAVVGNEFATFSQFVPAPQNPVAAFFSNTINDWTWDPIHIACVVLVGSLLVGMFVLVCMLCRRRRFKVIYTSKDRENFEKTMSRNGGSSTGNDETLSVGFPDVLGLSVPRSHEGSDHSSTNRSLDLSYVPSQSPHGNDAESMARCDYSLEEGLASASVAASASASASGAAFDPALYAYLDAEQHYQQASALEEDDLGGGWGSFLIPLPGSLRKSKPTPARMPSPPPPPPTSSSPKSASGGTETAANTAGFTSSGAVGILRPPSYSTSGPVDVDEARSNQASLDRYDYDDEYNDKEVVEDRTGWSSSSSCSGESVTLAYETDLDATVEIDMDTGSYLNKRMKKVSFKYVATTRPISPDRPFRPGQGVHPDDDGLVSDLDDDVSLLSEVYVEGGAAAAAEETSSNGAGAVTKTKAGSLNTNGASLPVDIDSLMTADQVGMMPTEIGTCATLALSAEDNRAVESSEPAPPAETPRPTFGLSVRRAASLLGLKPMGSGSDPL